MVRGVGATGQENPVATCLGTVTCRRRHRSLGKPFSRYISDRKTIEYSDTTVINDCRITLDSLARKFYDGNDDTDNHEGHRTWMQRCLAGECGKHAKRAVFRKTSLQYELGRINEQFLSTSLANAELLHSISLRWHAS